MEIKDGILAILLVCGLVLAIGILRRKAEILLNFIARMVVGLVAVYIVNAILAARGIDVAVGLNAFSALTLGSLGFGGFLLLYGTIFLNLL